jgi:hypothetical protein
MELLSSQCSYLQPTDDQRMKQASGLFGSIRSSDKRNACLYNLVLKKVSCKPSEGVISLFNTRLA